MTKFQNYMAKQLARPVDAVSPVPAVDDQEDLKGVHQSPILSLDARGLVNLEVAAPDSPGSGRPAQAAPPRPADDS